MHGLNLEKTKAGTRPEHNPQPIWGLQVRGLNLKKTEAVTRLKKTKAGTRPERLSSTNMGVPGAWFQPKEGGGGDKAGALILNQYGGPRCMVSTWKRRRRGQGRSIILNQYGGCRCVVST